MMVANIRTLYSGQRNYNGLATDIAMDMGVVPAEMEGPAEGELINAFQGGVKYMPLNITLRLILHLPFLTVIWGVKLVFRLLRLTGVPALLQVLSVLMFEPVRMVLTG